MHCYRCKGTENLKAKTKFSMICRTCVNQEATKYRKTRKQKLDVKNREQWRQHAEIINNRIMQKYA